MERGNFKLTSKGCDTLFRGKKRNLRRVINETMRQESISVMKEKGKDCGREVHAQIKKQYRLVTRLRNRQTERD